jgi:hypothetical protein
MATSGETKFRRYSEMRGGGGRFPDRPSPPSSRVVERVLHSAGLTGAAGLARQLSVREALETVEAYHG